MKKFYISAIFIFLFSSIGYPQIFKLFPEGIRFQLGIGYNQLTYLVHDMPPDIESYYHYREALNLTPTIRISYEIQPFNWLAINPFFGYDVAGGKSDKEADGYYDNYIFKQIDLGINLGWYLNNFTIGTGLKYNHHLEVIGEFYGVKDPSSYNKEDMSDLYTNNSLDVGFNISYRLNKFVFALEAWLGISNVEAPFLDEFVDVTKNRFILLLGYQL